MKREQCHRPSIGYFFGALLGEKRPRGRAPVCALSLCAGPAAKGRRLSAGPPTGVSLGEKSQATLNGRRVLALQSTNVFNRCPCARVDGHSLSSKGGAGHIPRENVEGALPLFPVLIVAETGRTSEA